jgi:hypothetical protein
MGFRHSGLASDIRRGREVDIEQHRKFQEDLLDYYWGHIYQNKGRFDIILKEFVKQELSGMSELCESWNKEWGNYDKQVSEMLSAWDQQWYAAKNSSERREVDDGFSSEQRQSWIAHFQTIANLLQNETGEKLRHTFTQKEKHGANFRGRDQDWSRFIRNQSEMVRDLEVLVEYYVAKETHGFWSPLPPI